MTWPVSIRTLLLLALAALLLAAPVQASGSLTAEAVQVEEGLHEGASRMAWLQSPDGSSFQLEITAASVEGTLYESRYVDGPDVPAPLLDRSIALDIPVPEDGDEAVGADTVGLRLEGSAPGYRLGLRVEQGATMAGSLQAETSLYAQDGARMDGSGIRAREGDAGNPGSDANFQVNEIPGPLLVTETNSGSIEYVLEGDFILEADELDFLLKTPDGERALRTVTHSEEAVDGGPENVEVDGFLRLHLEDARLVLTVSDFDGTLQTAMTDVHATPQGQVTFIDAEGLLETVAQAIRLDGESYTVADAPPFAAFGRDGRVDLQTEPRKEQGPLADLAQALKTPWNDLPQGALFVGTLSVGFLLAVLAAAALASPSMGRVESAIGHGRYRRAANMAGRILSRHPRAENAQVARAVALSKSGDHSKVIQEVEASLSKSDPSDGVLHYVLGLAYMETGRHKEAADRFKQAMDRTPELGPEVERILPTRRRGPSYGYV